MLHALLASSLSATDCSSCTLVSMLAPCCFIVAARLVYCSTSASFSHVRSQNHQFKHRRHMTYNNGRVIMMKEGEATKRDKSMKI